MCVRVCACGCARVCVCVCTRVCMRVYACVHVCACVFVSMSVCVCARACVRVFVCVCVYACVRMQTLSIWYVCSSTQERSRVGARVERERERVPDVCQWVASTSVA